MTPGQQGTGRGRSATTLVGRGQELATARAALAARRPVVVTGGAGAGRTALARAALHGTAVAWGGGLVALPDRRYVALERALADEAPSGDPTDPTGNADAGVVAAWVTGRLAGRALAVDDLQLTHPATPAVLARLAGAIPLVVTIATEHPRASELCRQVARWARRPAVVDLAPLDRESSARLVRRHAPTLADGEVERLAAAAGGSPARLVASAAAAAAAARRALAAPPPAAGQRIALTPRESEVLGLIAAGGTTSRIACRLGITESTVESHVRAIRTKFGVPTRTAAAAWAS